MCGLNLISYQDSTENTINILHFSGMPDDGKMFLECSRTRWYPAEMDDVTSSSTSSSMYTWYLVLRCDTLPLHCLYTQLTRIIMLTLHSIIPCSLYNYCIMKLICDTRIMLLILIGCKSTWTESQTIVNMLLLCSNV